VSPPVVSKGPSRGPIRRFAYVIAPCERSMCGSEPHRHEPEGTLPEIGERPPYMRDVGVPQDVFVPERHEHTGKEIFWKALVTHVVTDGGTIRLWTRS